MTDAEQFVLTTGLNTKLQEATTSNRLQEHLLRVLQDVSYNAAKAVVANERIADTLEELLNVILKERDSDE